MEKFETFVKAHPERIFFKWNANKDVLHTTQTLCLQQLGFLIPPSMILLAVAKDDYSGEVVMTSPLRLEWAVDMTIEEMNKFIDISSTSTKKAILLQKNRH